MTSLIWNYRAQSEIGCALKLPPLHMQKPYSLDNVRRFGWSSISGNVSAIRVEHLRNALTGQTKLGAGCRR